MRSLAILTVLGALALPASCAAATVTGGSAVRQTPGPASTAAPQSSSSSTTPVSVPLSDTPPAGRRLSPNQVLAIAAALPKIKAARAKYRGSFGGTYLKSPLRWQASFFSSNGKKEIGQVFIDDASGRVLEQWTGFQVPWSMARGYPGAFGRHVNALYVWLPLCVLFALPFFNFRRPLALANLDLLALLSFSISLAFFNHANIWASVPLVYPPLLYLLARMLALLRRGRAQPAARPEPLRLLVPVSWLAVAVVFLLGFRIALNVTDANVIDVGYAGVIGAQRITHERPLYGSYPSDNERGDTYGPVQLRGLRPLPAAVRVERHVGRPARRPRCRDCVRPAGAGAAVPAGAADARTDARRGLGLRVGHLSRSRSTPWRATPTTRSSRSLIIAALLVGELPLAPRAGRPGRARGTRGPHEVRAARARAGSRHPRAHRATRAAAGPASGHRRPLRARLRRGGGARVRAGGDARFAAHDLSSARSPIRPIVARPSRSGASTAGSAVFSSPCRSPRWCSPSCSL